MVKLDKDVAYAQKLLVEREKTARKEGRNRGQVSYVVAYRGSRTLCNPQISRSCFGGLLDRNEDKSSKHAGYGTIVGFISLIILARPVTQWPGHPHLYTKDRDQWLHWVLKDSPWASAFITKSVPKALKSGIVCHVDIPSNFLIGGLMAIRAVTDNTRKVTVWAELVKHGLDKRYAYLASHFFTPSRKKGETTHSIQFRGRIFPSAEHMALGHYFFHSHMPMRNFLNGLVVHPREVFKKSTLFTGVNGRSIHNMWGRGRKSDTWMLDCPKRKEEKAANSEAVAWAARSLNLLPYGSHHTFYHTPEQMFDLVTSITKQFDTIKAG